MYLSFVFAKDFFDLLVLKNFFFTFSFLPIFFDFDIFLIHEFDIEFSVSEP